MLERLDTIPWNNIGCLLGFADRVPQSVRELTFDDLSVATAAYWRLDNNVVVQGDLFEAAEYLPAFLFEALDLAQYKYLVLDLLFQIGNGQSLDCGMEARCHQVVVDGLERWLEKSANIEVSLRAAAEQDLEDLRELRRDRHCVRPDLNTNLG